MNSYGVGGSPDSTVPTTATSNMAEALGAIASVLTIVETIACVTKAVRSCKNAPKESQRLVYELSYLRGILDTLKERSKSNET